MMDIRQLGRFLSISGVASSTWHRTFAGLVCLVVSLILALAFPTFSAQGQPAPMSLAALIMMADEDNPEILAARQAAAAAKAQLDLAKAEEIPQADLAVTIEVLSTATETSLNFTSPLWRQAALKVLKAKLIVQQKEKALEVVRQNVALRVAKAYLTLLRAREESEHRQSIVRFHEARLALIQEQQDHLSELVKQKQREIDKEPKDSKKRPGLEKELEKLKDQEQQLTSAHIEGEASKIKADLEFTVSNNKIRKARADLKAIIGLDPLDPTEILLVPLGSWPAKIPAEDELKSALARPEVDVAKAALEAAKVDLEVTKAKGASTPTFIGSAGVDTSPTASSGFVKWTVKVTLADAGRNAAAQREAQANVEVAAREVDKVQVQVVLEARRAFLDLQAKERGTTFKDLLLTNANQALNWAIESLQKAIEAVRNAKESEKADKDAARREKERAVAKARIALQEARLELKGAELDRWEALFVLRRALGRPMSDE